MECEPDRIYQIPGQGGLSRSSVGGKAYYLNELMRLGLQVPPSLVIPVSDNKPSDSDVADHLDSLVGGGPEWKLAIRSSSADEDGHHESKAGHFLSLLGPFNRVSVGPAIEDVRKSGPRMAIVIQPLINALVAGVAFSCNPLTYSRDEVSVTWTEGLAEGLVSGFESGHRLHLNKSGKVGSGTWPLTIELLTELFDGVRAIENELGHPVDVEWVVDIDHKLWFVQARPIVLPIAHRLPLDSESNFDLLPPLVRQHHKIRLRRSALTAGVVMAPAIVDSWMLNEPDEPGSTSVVFPKAAGVSVVLLQPERVDNQVIRDFAAVHGSDVEFFTRGCRRYAIRRYPGASSTESAMAEVLTAGLAKSWMATAIAQAVWSAYATGIVKRFGKDYVVDIALGHFVPKGVVSTTTAIVSESKEVLSVTRREQPTAYHFVDGHVVTETPPHRQLRISNDVFVRVITTFEPLFELYETAAFEFGVIDNQGETCIYLIDLAEGDIESMDLNAELISSGVLSAGKCRGRIEFVELSPVGELDRHLHDNAQIATGHGDQVVVIAERASVELLPLVGAPGVVGFIFERGSVLSHLAVVLRERGIPAVTLEDRILWESLVSGGIVEVDASSPLPVPANRVIVTRSEK